MRKFSHSTSDVNRLFKPPSKWNFRLSFLVNILKEIMCIVSFMGSGILFWWWLVKWTETTYLTNITGLFIHLWIRAQRGCHLNYIILCPISWSPELVIKAKTTPGVYCESSYTILSYFVFCLMIYAFFRTTSRKLTHNWKWNQYDLPLQVSTPKMWDGFWRCFAFGVSREFVRN